MLVVVSRLPYLEKPFDEDSAANAYGGRLILQGEPLYSSYHPGHHLPAVYYIFALAFFLFGDSTVAIRFFLALWLIPTAGLLYYLARTIADKKTSYLAASLFVLLSADYILEGHTAEIEMFANLPRIAGTLVLIKLLERRRAAWQFSPIGLIGAVAILFKAVYISPLFLAGLILLTQFWSHRQEKDAASNLLSRIFWIGAGFFLGLLPVVAYFGMLGLLPRVGLVFTLGQIHINSEPVNPMFIFLYPLSGLALANAPFFIIGLTGAFLLLWNKSIPSPPQKIMLLWLFMCFVEAGFSRNPYLHYYQLIVPPLSVLAACAINHLYQLARAHHKIKPVAWAVSASLLLAIGGAYLFANGGYLYHYGRYKIGQETYQEFVLNSWPPTGPMFVAIQDIANYIETRSEPDDRIYIWSNETQLYYWANRRCAVDFIWPIYVELAPIPGGQQEMQHRLLASTTKFIVIAQDNPPTWLIDGLAKHYSLVKTISERKIYQRLDSSGQVLKH
ncbi:MAG: glycosyltransferase family 39 protein [Chloroflexi bacterium]|nr:glycosyltransferase family 39 protein [Chloroflexota bacterium]